MAEKKVIEIEVKENFKQVEKDLNSLDKALENASGSINDVNKSFEDVYGDLQPLTTRMGEAEDRLYELANAGKTTTQEYKDLLKTVGDYRKVQISTDLAVDAASKTIGQKLGGALSGVTSGFSIAQGVMGAFGSESEEVEKALLKVQSALAIQQGLQGIRESKKDFIELGSTIKESAVGQRILTAATTAYTFVTSAATTGLKLFRVALVSTGIGAIIVLVGLLIANFDKVTSVLIKLSGYVIKAYDYFDNLGTGIKVLIGIFFPFIGVVYGAIKALEYFNVIDTKNERDMSARHVANIKRIDKELAKREEAKKARKKAYDEETGNIDRQIKLLEAQGKSTEALEKLQLKRSLTNQRELIKEARLNLQILRATNIGGVNDQIIKETLTAIAQMKQGILNTETDIKIARINNAKETTKKIKESDKELDLTKDELYQLEQKRLAELNKAELDSLNVIDAAKKANADMLLTEQELAIQKENEAYQIKFDNAVKFGQDTEDLEIEHLNNLNNINLTAQEKQIALEKDTAEKKLAIEKALNEQKATIQQQGLDVALQGIGVIKSVFEKSKGVQKAAVIAESAIGIAKMIISNKVANAGALASPANILVPGSAAPIIALNNISTGFGIAANVAATAKALSALGGGGAPSGNVGNDGGGGGGGFNPSFNVVGNSGINQLAGIQQQPVKAYITTGEVSTALSLERNTLQKTTF